MPELNGKVAIVTGAARGIGRAIAEALGSDGWTVVINFRANAGAAEEARQAVERAGGRALLLQGDVANAADRERLLEATLSAFGRVDLLVNNAGMAPRQRADILETAEASYDEVMAVNLRGPFFLTQSVAKAMVRLVKQGAVTAPQIVSISSLSAYTSSTNRAEYCLSKAGIGMMTVLFADRLAEYGIGVFEIRPGIIATDMTHAVKAKYDGMIAAGLTPIARWGQPEDVARAVLAVASGAFPFSTGEVINVDGGFHLRRL
jgi:3-oxoacyl-[acyl-carrier protein] reductase